MKGKELARVRGYTRKIAFPVPGELAGVITPQSQPVADPHWFMKNEPKHTEMSLLAPLRKTLIQFRECEAFA